MVKAADLQPCVFLDRDGVIVIPEFRDGRSYAPKTLETFTYFPHAHAALTQLKKAGFLLIVVTNQPDVGNGIVASAVVEAMHQKILNDLPIDHIETCLHAQTAQCACRKPKPGLLLNALKKFRIDLAASYLIGDRSSDIEAGRAGNVTTILIDHQYEEKIMAPPDYVCKDLLGAMEIILKRFHPEVRFRHSAA